MLINVIFKKRKVYFYEMFQQYIDQEHLTKTVLRPTLVQPVAVGTNTV